MSAKNVLLGGSIILAIILGGSLIVMATLMKYGGSSDDAITGLATAPFITAAQAGSIASGAVKGTVEEIELEKENGNAFYSVEIINGKGEHDIKVDAYTGKILKIEVENDVGRKELEVVNPKISEEQAKKIALNAVNGKVTDMEAKKVNGVYVYEVEIQSNGEETDVLVNMMTGKIESVESETADNEDDEKEEDAETEEEDESEDVPITGTALDKASAAALKHIGEGRVTDTEIGDEEGYYEIEITLDNGREVDVHLDENFKVLGAEWEDDEEDD